MGFQNLSSGATSRKHQNKTALDFQFNLVWLLTMEESEGGCNTKCILQIQTLFICEIETFSLLVQTTCVPIII
jgi:hypothetical protein